MNARLKDMAEIYGRSFKSSFQKMDKVYITFLVVLLRTFFVNYRFRGMIFGNAAGGLIYYFIDAAILCFLAQALRSLVVYGNSGKKSISNSISNFWQPVLSTIFFVYLIRMVINIITRAISPNANMFLVVLFEFIISAMIEQIYINGKSGFEAIKQSGKFVCDNILTYGIFVFIILLLEFYINFNYGIKFVGSRFIYVLILAVIDTIFYVVKGHMFKYINNHPYRQRKFMRG